MDVGVRSPVKFTVLSGRWVGNTGCPAKSPTKGGHPSPTLQRDTLSKNIFYYSSYKLQNLCSFETIVHFTVMIY
jgi:hypothetical protein